MEEELEQVQEIFKKADYDETNECIRIEDIEIMMEECFFGYIIKLRNYTRCTEDFSKILGLLRSLKELESK